MGKRKVSQSDFAAAILMEKIVRDTYQNKRSSEIQPLQWSILRYCARNPEERCTLRWIAKFLGLTVAPVSRAIQTLQKKGLISLRTNPNDARSTIISLTDDGIARLVDDPILMVVNMMNSLPREEKEQLKKSLRQMIVAAEIEGNSKGEKDPVD